jgi:hypothetical protein
MLKKVWISNEVLISKLYRANQKMPANEASEFEILPSVVLSLQETGLSSPDNFREICEDNLVIRGQSLNHHEISHPTFLQLVSRFSQDF